MLPSVSIRMNWYFLIRRFRNLYNHTKFCITRFISHSLNWPNRTSSATLSSLIIVLINGEPFTICCFSLTFQQILPRRSVLSECSAVSRCTCRCNCICAKKKHTVFLAPVFTKLTIARQDQMRVLLYRVSPKPDNTGRHQFLPWNNLVDFYCKWILRTPPLDGTSWYLRWKTKNWNWGWAKCFLFFFILIF